MCLLLIRHWSKSWRMDLSSIALQHFCALVQRAVWWCKPHTKYSSFFLPAIFYHRPWLLSQTCPREGCQCKINNTYTVEVSCLSSTPAPAKLQIWCYMLSVVLDWHLSWIVHIRQLCCDIQVASYFCAGATLLIFFTLQGSRCQQFWHHNSHGWLYRYLSGRTYLQLAHLAWSLLPLSQTFSLETPELAIFKRSPSSQGVHLLTAFPFHQHNKICDLYYASKIAARVHWLYKRMIDKTLQETDFVFSRPQSVQGQGQEEKCLVLHTFS